MGDNAATTAGKYQKAMALVGGATASVVGIMSDLAREGAADQAAMQAVTTAAENAAGRYDEVSKSLDQNKQSLAVVTAAYNENVAARESAQRQIEAERAQLSAMVGTDAATVKAKAALSAEIKTLESNMKEMDKQTGALDKQMTLLGASVKDGSSQLKSLGVSSEDVNAQLSDYINHMRDAAAIGDDEMKPVLASLISTTGDYQKSMQLASIAADLARGKHMDLKSAAELVGKVSEGNTGILKRYGIVLGQNATAEEALAELQKRFAGQAEAYGSTTQGQMEALNNRIGDFREDIGSALGAAAPFLAMLPGLSAGFSAAGVAVGALTSGQVANTAATIASGVAHTGAAVATGVVTAAQWLLNAALTANPIGIVIVAIGALVAAFIYAYNNSEDFRRIVDMLAATLIKAVETAISWATQAVADLSNAFQSVIAWLSENWPLIAILITGPFAPLVALATDAFGVRTALLGALNTMVADALQKGAEIGTGLMKAINHALRLVKFPFPKVKIEFVSVGTPLGAVQVPNFSLGIDWKLLADIIPELARGIDYFRGGLALVGERGPEIVNLPRGSQVIPNDRIGSVAGASTTIHYSPTYNVARAPSVVSEWNMLRALAGV